MGASESSPLSSSSLPSSYQIGLEPNVFQRQFNITSSSHPSLSPFRTDSQPEQRPDQYHHTNSPCVPFPIPFHFSHLTYSSLALLFCIFLAPRPILFHPIPPPSQYQPFGYSASCMQSLTCSKCKWVCNGGEQQ
jgi:hypothetical protein